MTYEVSIDGVARLVQVERAGEGRYRVQVDGGAEQLVDARWLAGSVSLRLGNRSLDAGLVRREGGWEVNLRGVAHDCKVVDPRRKALRMSGGAQQGELTTSMPGRVVAVLVKPGDVVQKGQGLVVLEAMKMENELRAPVAGTVEAILVQPGAALEANARLLRIVPLA